MAKIPDGVWYDANNLDQLHADLLADYDRVLAVIQDRPFLRRHFRDCSTCQEVKQVREQRVDAITQADPADPTTTFEALVRRRKKFVFSLDEIKKLLGLSTNQAVLFMRVTGEHDTLEVTVCDPSWPVVPYNSEPGVLRIETAVSPS